MHVVQLGGFPDPESMEGSIFVQGQRPEEGVEEVEGKDSGGKMETGRKRKVLISFNDYHTLWKGIATSVARYRSGENVCKSSRVKLLMQKFM